MDGSTTKDANCHLGADGGPGVSCAVDFNGTYAHTYNLDVRNTEGSTWTGTAIDTVTGIGTHIGTFTLPKGGTTLAWQIGFVEYFFPTPPCNQLPYTSVVFGVPTTDAGVGRLDDPYEVGDCAGQDNFRFSRTADNGLDISAGFLAKAINVHTQPKEEYRIGNGLLTARLRDLLSQLFF